MNDLHHFFYLSASHELMSAPALADILAVSRRNNGRDGLSGMLLYQDGVFVQYIEGPLEPLTATKDRILLDPRHTNVIRMTEGPANARLFPDWSMGFQDADRIGEHLGGFDLSFATLDTRIPDSAPAYLRGIMRRVYMNAA